MKNYITLIVAMIMIASVAWAANVTDQTELTTVTDDDILYIIDDPAGTPVDRKITRANLLAAELTTSSVNISGAGTSTITSSTGLAITAVGAGTSINLKPESATNPQFQVDGTAIMNLTGGDVNFVNLTDGSDLNIGTDLTNDGTNLYFKGKLIQAV